MGEVTGVLVAAAALAATHLAAGRLPILSGIPRTKWLSFAGGIAVAYVFAHLLPYIANAEAQFSHIVVLRPFEHLEWLLVMAGLALFYALEHLALGSGRERNTERGGSPPGTFWVSIVSFAIYNAVIGYLLRDRWAAGATETALYAVALGVHFLVNDVSLREHHKSRYDRIGRWLIAGAILLGAAGGLAVEVDRVVVVTAMALLSGGIILNVLKEELPGERRASVSAFLVGLLAYTALIIAG
ncbi:MAG: hypothetical protein KY454_02450 [Actinobacteria bacterium]|nr:hypothetical protein [Actinomycetota bacterium]MBW3649963.1 hypothetical protein [Actinomycetota bacterium]